MTAAFAAIRRHLAPVWLGVWPGLSNPAWDWASAASLFGKDLEIPVAPSRITRKVKAEAVGALRSRFLVTGLDQVASEPISELYTHRDMEDIARHGADWRATRMGQWLKAAIDSGRPPFVRGAFIRNEAEIEAYYRGYLTMFESMRDHGYRYEGDDQMCFGIGAKGGLVLVRRGTHRLAAAQILDLPRVAGRVTNIDRRFAETARQRSPELSVRDAIRRAVAALAAA